MINNENIANGFDMNQSESVKMVADMARDFAEKHIRPYVMEWDEAQIFPIETLKKMGELGLLGMLVPEEFGGAGLGYFEYSAAIQEIAKVCGSVGLSMAAHNSLCTGHIMYFGSQAQKEKWLSKLATAEWIGAWGLTEANTGSDALRMTTTAVLDGDHYILNGAKNWITHGKSGDVAVVMVRTGEKGDSKGISAIVVEKGTPGFTAGKKENKLGMRASETTEMIFDNCRVPKENLLGKEGEGFKQAMQILDGGRISIAALSLGIAKGAFIAATNYAKERHQFGQAIANFQGISFKLADMATRIEAARLMVHKAAWLKDQKKPFDKEGAMAKLYASKVAMEHTVEAVQIHGGNGFVKDYHVERLMRDAKITQIYEGTSEIQKIVISRSILRD